MTTTIEFRPSRQVRDPQLVVDRVLATRPRGPQFGVLKPGASGALRSSPSMANPNRSTSRWGKVVLASGVAPTPRSSSPVVVATPQHQNGFAQSRSAHPASARGSATRPFNGRVANVPARRAATTEPNVVPFAPRTTPVTPIDAPDRSRQVSASASLVGRGLNPGRPEAPQSVSTGRATGLKMSGRSDGRTVGASSVASASSVGATEFRPRGSGTSSARSSRSLTSTLKTEGSAALAAHRYTESAPRRATPERSRESVRDAHLRVALAPRRVIKRSSVKAAMFFAVATLAISAATAAVVVQARLAEKQEILDGIRVDVSTAERTNDRLRVEVADLESPTRVLLAASEMGLQPVDAVFTSSDAAATR